MKTRKHYTKFVDMSLARALDNLCLLGARLQHYWVLRLSADVTSEKAEKIIKKWLDSFRKRFPQVAGIYVKNFTLDGCICINILLGEWYSGGVETGCFRFETEYDSEGEPTFIQIPISSVEVYARETWVKLRAKHGNVEGSFEARELNTSIYGNPEPEIIRVLTNPNHKQVPSSKELTKSFKFWGFINKVWLEREPLRETNVERYYEDGTLLWKISDGRWISFDDAPKVLNKKVFDELYEKTRKNPMFSAEEIMTSMSHC